MRPPFYADWLRRFDGRLDLRRRVMAALGIVPPRRIGPETREVLRQTMIACSTCDHAGSCAAWLELGDPRAGPPAFCPNHDRFLQLLSGRS